MFFWLTLSGDIISFSSILGYFLLKLIWFIFWIFISWEMPLNCWSNCWRCDLLKSPNFTNARTCRQQNNSLLNAFVNLCLSNDIFVQKQSILGNIIPSIMPEYSLIGQNSLGSSKILLHNLSRIDWSPSFLRDLWKANQDLKHYGVAILIRVIYILVEKDELKL